MGDIQTHAAIEEAVEAVLPASEPRAFVELGNFLTDVSQFRDPYAHLSGKKRIWQTARDLHPEGFVFGALDLFIGVDNYLDELMGVPGKGPREGSDGDPATWRPDDGALAAWFRDLILAYSTERFARGGLDKASVLAVFDRRFTQYYPHEHMDFPPWPDGSALGAERGRRSAVDLPDGSGTRRLLAYLDDQLEYVSDLLTRVEKEWAQVAPNPDDVAARRLQLAAYGHASHALEDFFFHSNFVELAWEQGHPGEPEAPTRPLPPPTPEELESFGPPVSDVHRRRIYHRRRRAPLADPDDKVLSETESAASEDVYTGQFGSNDIFFTFVDALGHLLMTPARRPGAFEILREPLRRTLFGTPEEQRAALAEHHRRLVSHEYVRMARAGQLAGRMEPFEVEAIDRACAVDLRLATEYGSIDDGTTPLGIVGMLQQLMAKARETAKASAERGAVIDGDNALKVRDERSDNGAPSDNIGSHTLMAKDSVRKEPLRVEATNLATVAATFVARTMAARQAAGAPATPGGTDWAAVLRSFVGHPGQAGAAPWWEPALTSTAEADQRPPDVPALAATAFEQRAAEPGRRALERRYEELSAVAHAQYRSTVNEAFILDAGLTAAMLGGLSGLISGLANGDLPNTPDKGFAAGGLGLVAGGVAGLLGTMLTTAVATEIDDSAGAVTGAAIGWAGSLVGGWMLGDLIADQL